MSAAEAEAFPAPPKKARRREHALTYRPHLDGLRAIAVYLVVAFHAGLGVFSGGFIGVDVFFVLSGFLVTSLLMRDLARHQRVQWRNFYSRRARRILPAAAVTLVVTAIVYQAIATPLQVSDAVGSFRAAFLYVANWYFIHQSTSYFGANVSQNPVLHFWSLAIEEQFYLIWPLAISVLYVISGWARRWQWWVLRSIVGAAALASALTAIHVSATNLDRAYYGTETRAYQLLAGALIALTPQLLRLPRRVSRWAQWIAIVAFVAIVLVATSFVHWGPITRGVAVALLASALIVALENARGGRLERALSVRPLTYLGRISYGTYLWHWPLIVFLTYNRTIAPVPLFALDAVGATVVAAVSFKLLEQPIRTFSRLDRYRTPVIAVGLATSIVLGVLVTPLILDTPSSVAAPTGKIGKGEALLDWRKAKTDFSFGLNCLNAPVSNCTVVKGKKLKVLLIGDSHANMWIPAFRRIALNHDWTLSVAGQPGCAWQRGLYFAGPLFDGQCQPRQADWYDRLVPKLDPDLIVLVDKAYDDPRFKTELRFPDGSTKQPGDAGYEQGLIDASKSTLDALRKQGRKVLIIEPVPLSFPFSPVSCLSTGKPARKCTFKTDTKPAGTPLEQYYRSVSGQPNVRSMNPDRLVCPRLPLCDPIVNNIIVFADEYSHMTRTYSRSLVRPVTRVLRNDGFLATP